MNTQEFNFDIEDNDNIISIKGCLPISIKEDRGYYIIHSPIFKTFGTSNKSIEDAIKDHEKDLFIFFKIHQSRGDLKQILYTLGLE